MNSLKVAGHGLTHTSKHCTNMPLLSIKNKSLTFSPSPNLFLQALSSDQGLPEHFLKSLLVPNLVLTD